MKKPKLLALFPSYHSGQYSLPVGGGEISNRALLEGLVIRGWQVEVVACNTDIDGAHGGVRVHKIVGPRSRLASALLRQRKLKNLGVEVAKEFQPDVIVCGPTALAFSSDVAAVCGARHGLMIRAFENFEWLAPEIKGSVGLKKKIAKKFLGNYQVNRKPANFYVFNSNYMAERLSGFIDGPAYTIYPSVDVGKNKKNIESIKNVHMVGLTIDKGYRILKEVAFRFPGFKISVYGKRSDLILDQDLPVNVTYKGWADKNEVYGDADLFLVPSQCEEAFGRVSVEALAFGCIVLVSEKGGLPETVDFDNNLIVKADNSEQWCDKIYEVMNNLEVYRSYADHASDKIGKYSIDIQIVEFEKLLYKEMK